MFDFDRDHSRLAVRKSLLYGAPFALPMARLAPKPTEPGGCGLQIEI